MSLCDWQPDDEHSSRWIVVLDPDITAIAQPRFELVTHPG